MFEGDAIVRLRRRVTHVAVETVRIVAALPDLGLPSEPATIPDDAAPGDG